MVLAVELVEDCIPIEQFAASGLFEPDRDLLPDVLQRRLPVLESSQPLANHLAGAHSWYKHLPLLGGGEFIIFLDPEPARGHPLEHPRLPGVESPRTNSAADYLAAFGHLNYLWRASPAEPFDTDGECPTLDGLLLHLGRFTLYPYVSSDFYWSAHEDAVEALRAGIHHPQARQILSAADAGRAVELADAALTHPQRELLLALDEDPPLDAVPEPVRAFCMLEAAYDAAMDDLRLPEEKKLRHVVLGLQARHAHQRGGPA